MSSKNARVRRRVFNVQSRGKCRARIGSGNGALQLRERAIELLSFLPSGSSALSDITASVADAEVNEKQVLLETIAPVERADKLLKILFTCTFSRAP